MASIFAACVGLVAETGNEAMKPPQVRKVARLLMEIEGVRFGKFRLKDGRESPFYVDLRSIVAFPRALQQVGKWLARAARPVAYDCIAAVPYAGLPIGVAMSFAAGKPLVYPRKEPKNYGTERVVEGRFLPGQCALLVDDVLTSASAKLESVRSLRAVGLVVRDVLVVVDRQEQGREILAQQGIRVHALVGIRELLHELFKAGVIAKADYDSACQFLGLDVKCNA